MGARRNILHTAYLPTYRPHAGDGRKRNLPGVCQNFLSAGFAAAALHIGALVLYFLFIYFFGGLFGGFSGGFSGSVNSASVVFGVMLAPCLSKRYADRREEARSSSVSLL